ncbi:ATP-binding response regulator [Tengunoibacter tsumagoiensis]|uniref:histidine kinase n=1 Tax=Tengunoibacter tsumagoiensis TaxID=2014871 RepID=A0A401ZVA6_9CHLR|nr:response regulator [Tengunoibacter tsumagoiensis]GCE10831.1 hypothetical protein KTT_06900 [Tengunoibacter tsumagoiensis]
MNELLPPSNDDDVFDDKELSAEDLAVLQAFDAIVDWPLTPIEQSPITPHLSPASPHDEDEMLSIFQTEAEEDITRMRYVLQQFDKDTELKHARFVPLRRAGHKLRGTAAAMDFPVLSELSSHVEIICEQVEAGRLPAKTAYEALSQTVMVLELSLSQLLTTNQELNDELLLNDLTALYQELKIDLSLNLQQAPDTQALALPETIADKPPVEDELVDVRIPSQLLQDNAASAMPASKFIRVDTQRFTILEQHSEQWQEQRVKLENAQLQVDIALQELQTAQNHLQLLEQQLPLFLHNPRARAPLERSSGSSLVDRILHEASAQNESHSYRPHRTAHSRRIGSEKRTGAWDELDMEHYTEKDILVNSLKEAIADISICSQRVHSAYLQLHVLQDSSLDLANQVHKDMLLMRLAPLSTLVPRIQRVIALSALAQEYKVEFEVQGEQTEIDQEILEELSNPLIQLIRTCISDVQLATESTTTQQRIWLHATGSGNEITIEIGFSMPVAGGAVEAIHETMQQVKGEMEIQRNGANSLSFILHFPRSQGTAHCLLLRTGTQYVIVPLAQIQRVGERRRDKVDVLYHLHRLLGFPEAPTPPGQIHPVLLLVSDHTHDNTQMSIGVAVDEVVGEIQLVTRPLKPHLQRPGITGSAVDGQGRVLLMINLPELVKHYKQNTHVQIQQNFSHLNKDRQDYRKGQTEEPLILVADDAVYLRHSVIQTLKQANYRVLEARDGMEALEQLRTHQPGICLLDIEMPNLTGFDLLEVMRHDPRLADTRAIMLTSRSSDKHIQRAYELGAYGYLIKPVSREDMLIAITKVLQGSRDQ